MKNYFFLCTVFLFAGHSLKAQTINTDSPDQSDGSHIVEKKQIQIETGVQFSKLDEITKGFDNVTLVRYGVTKNFEVRFLNQYTTISDSRK